MDSAGYHCHITLADVVEAAAAAALPLCVCDGLEKHFYDDDDDQVFFIVGSFL